MAVVIGLNVVSFLVVQELRYDVFSTAEVILIVIQSHPSAFYLVSGSLLGLAASVMTSSYVYYRTTKGAVNLMKRDRTLVRMTCYDET